MKKALVPLAEGFEEIEALTIVDILRRGGVEVVTAALDDAGSALAVNGAHGVEVKADALITSVAEEEYDVIVLPGGPGTPNLLRSEALTEALRRQNGRQGLLAAICAAPTVLTELGLVEPGLQVTCYPSCMLDLDRRRSNAPVIHDGNVITGEAPGSAMLFALVVLQTLVGEVAAGKVARGLVTDVL